MAKGKSVADSGVMRQKSHFQFLTTPTADTPGTTLMLHFDSRRYFFGRVAEGTQRAFMQRGVGIKKAGNLFLTGPITWDTMGGMIGLILTLADVQGDEIDPTTGKRPALNIHGGPKLTHSIACARRFVFRTGMPLQIREADPNDGRLLTEPSYSDENINVWSIPVKRRGRSGASSPTLPSGRSGSPATVTREQHLRTETVQNMFDSDWRKDRLIESRFDEVKLPALVWTRNPDTKGLQSVQCTTMADAPHLQPESKVLVRNPWPASMVEELPPVNNVAGSVAMSYIVKSLPQRGKFLPEKAKALGVKPGPNYSRLAAGGSITLDDGKVITSDMVLGPTEPGRGMVILDVPSNDYIEDLSEKIEDIKGDVMVGIEAVSWILGEGVFESPRFAQLVESLPDFRHFISSPETSPNCLSFDSAAASGIRLAQIRPECFLIPLHDNQPTTTQSLPPSFPYTPAQRGLIVQITPEFVVKDAEVPPPLDVEATKASYRDNLNPLLPKAGDTADSQTSHGDVEILTFGTGSAVPSKYRNVSATLVRIPELGSYLFDCGENTLGMMRRAYTPSQLDELLIDLRLIWISHLHADHHLGTMSVINAKHEAMQRLGQSGPQLHIISEPNMADYLRDFDSIQPTTSCTLLGIMNSQLTTVKDEPNVVASTNISQTTLPIKEFLTTKVSHCHGAQACSITFDNGFKFSYSGDCRPSAQFARIGRDSDVLLHEATFDDGLEGHAVAKKHSTTAEALAVAHAMKAKNVILTHFSQRYQKIPVLNNVKFGEIQFEEGDDAEEAGPVQDESASAQVINNTPSEPQKTGLDSPSTSPVEGDGSSMQILQQVAQDMNVCVAFDLMSVTVAQIRDMYKYYPAIEKMFELEQEKSDAQRDMRREESDRVQAERAEAHRQKFGPSVVSKKEKPAAGAASKGNVGGDIYSRINRNKPKDKAVDASSTIPPPQTGAAPTTPSTTTSSSGNVLLPISSPPSVSPLSKRGQKRMSRLAEAPAEREREADLAANNEDSEKRVKLGGE